MKKVFLIGALLLPLSIFAETQAQLEFEMETLSTRNDAKSLNGIENTYNLETKFSEITLKPMIGVEVASVFNQENATDLDYVYGGVEQKFSWTKVEAEFYIPSSEAKRAKENSVAKIKLKNKFALPGTYSVKTEAKLKQTFTDSENKQKYYAEAELIKKINDIASLSLVNTVESDLEEHVLLVTPTVIINNLAKDMKLEIFAEIPALETGNEDSLATNITDNSTLGLKLNWQLL